jgi:hypothetical protein
MFERALVSLETLPSELIEVAIHVNLMIVNVVLDIYSDTIKSLTKGFY